MLSFADGTLTLSPVARRGFAVGKGGNVNRSICSLSAMLHGWVQRGLITASRGSETQGRPQRLHQLPARTHYPLLSTHISQGGLPDDGHDILGL